MKNELKTDDVGFRKGVFKTGNGEMELKTRGGGGGTHI